MNKYQFVEPNWNGPNEFSRENAVIITVSDWWIERMYFPHWKEKMIAASKKDNATLARCIDDFCITHWATEL